jgi:hypothetical protein
MAPRPPYRFAVLVILGLMMIVMSFHRRQILAEG